jgi:hypothetical protein
MNTIKTLPKANVTLEAEVGGKKFILTGGVRDVQVAVSQEYDQEVIYSEYSLQPIARTGYLVDESYTMTFVKDENGVALTLTEKKPVVKSASVLLDSSNVLNIAQARDALGVPQDADIKLHGNMVVFIWEEA